MANPQLTVEISAKIDGLRDAFSKAVKEINGLDANTKKSLSSIDKGFEKLANDIDSSMSKSAASTSKASSTITKNLATAANATAKAGQGIAVGANQAGNALTNLGRVAQDAPFGFVGIQNNLNPLLESFQRLRAESGSNSAALKALGQSLAGPAGLGIALSVVSAGVLLYQQYQQRANKAIQDAKKTTDDYVASLETIEGARLKGEQNAQKEIVTLGLLFRTYQNANQPLSARKEAYSELQKQYPSYFGNLAFEEKATNATKDAYNRLTQSIIASAKARSFSDKIAENSQKVLEIDQKIADLAAEIKKSKESDTSLAAALGGSAETRDIYEQQLQLQVEKREALEQNLRLEKEINKEVAKGGKISGGFGGGGGTGGGTKKSTPKLNTTRLPSFTGEGIGIGSVLQQLQAPITLPQVTVPPGLSEYIKLMQEAYYSNVRFGDSVKQLGATALSSGISEAFSAIGQSLSDGTNAIDAFGTAILSAFSSFLNQLGQMFIKEGIALIGTVISSTSERIILIGTPSAASIFIGSPV